MYRFRAGPSTRFCCRQTASEQSLEVWQEDVDAPAASFKGDFTIGRGPTYEPRHTQLRQGQGRFEFPLPGTTWIAEKGGYQQDCSSIHAVVNLENGVWCFEQPTSKTKQPNLYVELRPGVKYVLQKGLLFEMAGFRFVFQQRGDTPRSLEAGLPAPPPQGR